VSEDSFPNFQWIAGESIADFAEMLEVCGDFEKLRGGEGTDYIE